MSCYAARDGHYSDSLLAGKTVVAEGTLSRRVISAEEAEHLAEESGAAAPARFPREEWQLVATSVVLPSASR